MRILISGEPRLMERQCMAVILHIPADNFGYLLGRNLSRGFTYACDFDSLNYINKYKLRRDLDWSGPAVLYLHNCFDFINK